MAVRGAVLKEKIINQILENFPGSFLSADGKELRIQGSEDGEVIQVKVALTAAKDNIDPPEGLDSDFGGGSVMSGTSNIPSQSEIDTLISIIKEFKL